MKQIRMKNAEGKTYVFPACSDEEVDAQLQSIRMEIDPELVPVLINQIQHDMMMT